MKNLNRHIFTIFVVIVMSVFFIACGIPSYCELTNVKVNPNTQTTPKSYLSDTDCLHIYTTEDGETDLSTGKITTANPGLVLLFYQPDDITSILKSNTYKYSNGIMTYPAKQRLDPVITYDDNNFYAFYINESTVPATPSYITSLYKYINGSFLDCDIIIEGNYDEAGERNLESVTLIMPDDVSGNHVDPITLTFNRDIIFGDTPFKKDLGVYLAAAVVNAPSQGCSFDNFYWTYLNPIGVLKVHEETE